MILGEEVNCPFCSPTVAEKGLTSELCFARLDKYPVTEGHLLVIPNRHVADYFLATEEEKTALWAMVDEAKKLLDGRFKPDGYNVGLNLGTSAGPMRSGAAADPYMTLVGYFNSLRVLGGKVVPEPVGDDA